jgi:hypothetical protein
MLKKEKDCVYFAFCSECGKKSLCGFTTKDETAMRLRKKGWLINLKENVSVCPDC